MTKDWAVEVGANSFTDDDEQESDLHGPFTMEEAIAFRDEVREVWDKQDQAHFVHGEPYAIVRKLVHTTHPFYSRAALAASNWYEDPEA